MLPKHLMLLVIPPVLALAYGLASIGRADTPPCATITPAPAYSSINIRSSPAIGDNVTGRLLRGQVANVAGLAGGWYELSFGGYVSASVVVCVISPTPTRLVTDTPTPASTPLPPFTRLWIDVDSSGDYETVIDCLQPCRMKLEQWP